MPARRKVASVRRDSDWAIEETFTANGRHIERFTELKIRGERGRWLFLRHVSRPNGREWIDVIGGPKGHKHWRSFAPDRIKTVHRKLQNPENLMRKRKEAA